MKKRIIVTINKQLEAKVRDSGFSGDTDLATYAAYMMGAVMAIVSYTLNVMDDVVVNNGFSEDEKQNNREFIKNCLNYIIKRI